VRNHTGTETPIALAAGLLAIVFLGQAWTASLLKSPTSDEPPHIAGGVSYVNTGRIVVNLQHPPLLKEVSGLSLKIGAGVGWPDTEFSRALMQGRSELEWPVGNSIIHEHGADKVLFWARLPFLLLGALGAVVLYLWGRQLAGSLAALGAVLLYVLDPTIVAHSQLVTTDCGLAVLTILFLYALRRYLHRPDVKRLVLCGLALGAALTAKFSAVMLIPIAAVLLLAALRWPPRRDTAGEGGNPDWARTGANRNAPCPCGSGKKFKNCHGSEPARKADRLAWLRPGPRPGIGWALSAGAVMFAVAVVVIEAVYLFPSDPFLYLTGYQRVNADHTPDFLAYLAGRLEPHFLSYYLVAYLFKAPLAAILLAGFGLFRLFRDDAMPVLDRLFLLLPPAVMFAGYSIMTDDLGVRYIIPALPFLHLLGGMGLAALVRSGSSWKRAVAAALGLWLTVAAAGIYPDHLAYFNEMACALDHPAWIGWDGGTRCGPAWLNDSNVDWGQGLKQLKTWLDQNAPGRKVRMAYFGIYPPVGYGIDWEKVEAPELMSPTPGLYVVSAHMVAFVPAFGRQYEGGRGQWLRTTPPKAIVGHSYYIYDIH